MGKKRRTGADDIQLVDRDWLFGFTNESEKTLNQIVALFNSTSYRSSPDDILMMSDLPGRHIWIIKQEEDVIAACETTVEGNGVPRARGHTVSVNWVLQNTYPSSSFEKQVGIRIDRAGGEWEQVSRLIHHISDPDTLRSLPELPEGADLSYISAVCEIEQFSKYEALSFIPSAIMEPEETARYSLLLVRTVDPASTWPDVFATHFLKQIVFWLSTVYRDVPASVLEPILEKCCKSRDRVASSSKSRTHIDHKDTRVFLSARALSRLHRMRSLDSTSIRESMDAIRAVCLLYFGGYIPHIKVDSEVRTRLIEIGLQHHLNATFSDKEANGIISFFKEVLSSSPD